MNITRYLQLVGVFPWELSHAIPPLGKAVEVSADKLLLLDYVPIGEVLKELFRHPDRIEIGRIRSVS